MTAAAAAPVATTSSPAPLPRGVPGAFGSALARARAAAAHVDAEQARPLATSRAASALLCRRREILERQRRCANPDEETGPPAAVADPAAATAADGSDTEPTPAGSLFPASAIDEIAIAVRRERDRPSIELAFGAEIQIRVTRHQDGLELLLQTGTGSQAAADSELPRLMAGLRARGLRVVRARAQARDGDGGAPRALTPPRGSDRTAATLNPGGTVAKW